MITVMVTGGTGSFGQAFVRQVLDEDRIRKIIIYSRDEHKQEKMAAAFGNNDKLRFYIGDIRDKDRTKLAMRDVTHVVHAAALKVVPMGETNPMEFVKTNIIGTQNMLECSENVHVFITLSTDKAVMPVNLYGATKLAAERMTLAHNNVHGARGGSYNVVRYGNVANSNGSVIPIFANAYANCTPLPVTSEAMTRYWISLDDAAKFVYTKLYRSLTPEVYIPPMASFKIMDLVKAFNRAHKVIGVRPGEKIHETIDGIDYSDNNTHWLGVKELKAELKLMGHLK